MNYAYTQLDESNDISLIDNPDNSCVNTTSLEDLFRSN